MNIEANHSKFIESLFDFNISSFEEKALAIFRFQAAHNLVYKEYIELLGIDPFSIDRIENIPFLPIRFFKSHTVTTGVFSPELIFESSGTTGMQTSRHLVKEAEIYRKSFLTGFDAFYGNPKDWCIIGLLPSYLERQHSSLVFMVEELVQLSAHPQSGFYLYDHNRLHSVLEALEATQQQTLLIGVTFGLLDFAEQHSLNLNHTVVMETGGMKGRREEWTREEVHGYLQQRLGVTTVHSEYGMTELLSQGYSTGEGVFKPCSTMRILIREEEDPFAVTDLQGRAFVRGIINVIDLANIWSCSFIATDDAGTLYADGRFEVLGRVDNSDIRGCSLMVV